jgi:hypothetical protein
MALAHLPAPRRTARPKRSGPTLIQRSRAVSAEEKALYHNVTGAGRAAVRREFMGLNDEDQDVLTQAVADGIDRLLAGER